MTFTGRATWDNGRVRVAILGPLQVEDDAGRPVEIGGLRLRTLLTRLALDAGRPVSAGALVTALWGDTPPVDETNALQSLVSRLRRSLPDPAAIESGPAGYRLSVRPEAADAARFERLAAAGHRALTAGDPRTAAELLGEALALWRGTALADADGLPWATAARAALDERRLTATEDRYEAELLLGRHAAAVAGLEALAAEHPLRERLRGQLVRAFYAAGRQADALAAYEDLRRRLADELGVDPSPELQEIHLAVLRADPALAAPGPETSPRTNVPAQLTSFVGRDRDLAVVADLLDRHRLVTLVGPGGSGKTRLAGEAGVRVLDRFPDGVWLAELAPATGGDQVPQAVRTGVDLSPPGAEADSTPGDALSQLVDLLARRKALIVLDNCEHLIEAAAHTAGELLARCPDLRILATSREPLGITGEALAPVAPLGLPPADATPEIALDHPAVRLLADRAAAVRPGFAVDETTVGPVIEICRRLDGLPLAIELAAARMRSLPVEEVAARLDDRFRLLTGGSRTALPRHRTLRAVVAWSWDLLAPAERRLADRLAVFPGGIDTDAAAAVGAGPDLPPEEVPDLLAALTDKSLLQAVPGPEPRYRMLETLREYGQERLTADGTAEAVRRAHAAHFLALAEEAEPHLRRPEQVAWIARLTAERDNLLAALRFALDTGDADTAVRLGAALAWYWTIRSEHGTAATWLDAAADVPGPAPSDARAVCLAVGAISTAAAEHDFGRLNVQMARAKALTGADWPTHPLLSLLDPIVAMVTGDEDKALELITHRTEPVDPWARATGHFLTALLYENVGRFEEHRGCLDRALVGYRELGDRWGLASTLAALGALRLADGQLEESMAAYAEARGLMAEITASEDVSFTRTRLAGVYARAGDLPRARAELAVAQAEAERSGSVLGRLVVVIALAELARQDGDRAGARRLAESGLTLSEHNPAGPPQARAMVLATLACLDAEDGDTTTGTARIAEAAGLPGANRDMPVMGQVALAAAYVALLAEDAERAALLFGAALALRGTEERGSPEVIRLRHDLTEALGPAELDRRYADGAALPRERALALLRGDAALSRPGQVRLR